MIPIKDAKIFKRGSKNNPSYGIELPKHHIKEGRIDPEKKVNYNLEQENDE